MDSFDVDRVTNAFNGFINSLGQTGANLGNSISHLGLSMQDKVPQRVQDLIPILRRAQSQPQPPVSSWDSIYDWVSRHKWLVVFSASTVTVVSAYYLYKPVKKFRRTRLRKQIAAGNAHRKAVMAPDGGRSEVVVILGSPGAPLVKLLAIDLNIRGFIVYIVCTPDQKHIVQQHNSDDIRSLVVESITDPLMIRSTLTRFESFIRSPQKSFEGASYHELSLTGVLIATDLVYPTGPVETVSYERLQASIDQNILQPLNFMSSGGIEMVRNLNSRFVLLSPTIVGSLSLPYHATEASIYGALTHMSLSLHRELDQQGIPFTHIRLGSFDTSSVRLPSFARRSPSPNSSSSASYSDPRSAVQADIMTWPAKKREIYGHGYRASASWSHTQSTESLMILYFAVYDALRSKRRVINAGSGSKLYEFVSFWVPERIVGMLIAR